MRSEMSLPLAEEVRDRINRIPNKQVEMFCKAVYVLGAARASEMCGEPYPQYKTKDGKPKQEKAYGPRGTELTLTEYTPKEDDGLVHRRLLQVLAKRLEAENVYEPVDCAVFTVRIAKTRLWEGEETPSRLVALPVDEGFEPWTRELVDYWREAGGGLVFPFNRKMPYNWVRNHRTFEGLSYHIDKYMIFQNGEVVRTVLPHEKPLAIHGLRHIRTDELETVYGFRGEEFVAYVGWSMMYSASRQQQVVARQIERYHRLIKNWQVYFPKLLKRRNKARSRK